MAFILLVAISGQELPVPAVEALESPARPTSLFVLAAIGELLLMPGGLALYFALRADGKTPTFFATALWLTAAPMFLASRGAIIAVSQVGDRYTAAVDAATKAGYVTSAEIAIETQSMYSAMALILLSVASVVFGLVMLRSAFGGRWGYLLMAAGVFSTFSPFGVMAGMPDALSFIGLVLSAAWQLAFGIKLFNLGTERASHRFAPAAV